MLKQLSYFFVDTKIEFYTREIHEMSYYKFTARDNCHRGLKFQEGVNTALEPWNTRTCGSGGIYLACRETFWKWTTYREDLYWVWDAEIAPGSPWQLEPDEKLKHTKSA